MTKRISGGSILGTAQSLASKKFQNYFYIILYIVLIKLYPKVDPPQILIIMEDYASNYKTRYCLVIAIKSIKFYFSSIL